MIPPIEKTEDFADCLALRLAVFVDEQKVPVEEEVDDLDPVATHFIARDAEGRPVGTARIVEIDGTGKIGRVCVAREHRGTGLGAALIEACLAELRLRPHLTRAKLGAQTHAIGFYARFGFEPVGAEYLDGGIPHRDMVMPL
ncbi:GNAT family N-acetyltransferase [Celeribacter indicus]|uniref:N-acetyltransferase GCN5 n=1 Tax=Celeribacter indicus TaxID=1208324 RepID=A0A0B5DX22_9RHOB|nr:GNAT family N-acetyltransferase [Celeribacter indicus]AJE44767.1 N-acetyltransferase GCN5 [Celeribacter indicus]SDX46465.1 Predicted N-acyltransferase, GNAT family [Celeribacter indicus]